MSCVVLLSKPMYHSFMYSCAVFLSQSSVPFSSSSVPQKSSLPLDTAMEKAVDSAVKKAVESTVKKTVDSAVKKAVEGAVGRAVKENVQKLLQECGFSSCKADLAVAKADIESLKSAHQQIQNCFIGVYNDPSNFREVGCPNDATIKDLQVKIETLDKTILAGGAGSGKGKGNTAGGQGRGRKRTVSLSSLIFLLCMRLLRCVLFGVLMEYLGNSDVQVA